MGCHSWRSILRAASGLGVAGGLGWDVAIGDEGGTLLLGGFAQFAKVDVQWVAGVVARDGQLPAVLFEVSRTVLSFGHKRCCSRCQLFAVDEGKDVVGSFSDWHIVWYSFRSMMALLSRITAAVGCPACV